jgi:phage terminase large subunit
MVALRTDANVWRPFAGAQTAFLASPAFEALFGGAAGPGKTECLIMEALRQIANPRYNAILFRRTFPELEGADGLIARSHNWYPAFGGKYNDNKHRWEFPAGARIYFGHLQRDDDVNLYQSWQLQYIGFDELTHFTERQYLYLFSRCRADVGSGLRCYVRAATNPGGVGHTWVKRRFITSDVRNKVRYFARLDDKDTAVDRFHPDARSRVFIPATHKDNPLISPEYVANLRQMDAVERARLEAGDWDAAYTDGIYANWSLANIDADRAEYNPALPVYWAVDDGYKNPRVVLLCQRHDNGAIGVFYEYYKSQQLFDQTTNDLLALPYPRPAMAIHDPAAAEFAAHLQSAGVMTYPADNDVSEGIKAVRDYICDGQGIRSLFVHPRCEKLIEELPGYAWQATGITAGGDPKPVKENDHTCDAIRYLIKTPYSPTGGIY